MNARTSKDGSGDQQWDHMITIRLSEQHQVIAAMEAEFRNTLANESNRYQEVWLYSVAVVASLSPLVGEVIQIITRRATG